MTYKCIGENWGRSMIRDAIKAGYTVEVSYEYGHGEPEYKGTSLKKAWDAVTAVDECHVFIRRRGMPSEWAFIVLDYGQEGDEVICDFSCARVGRNWIEKWWNAKGDKADARKGRS